jgi:hypothetical protein
MDGMTVENHHPTLLHLFFWTVSVLRVIGGLSVCILGLISSSFLNLLKFVVD